MEKNSKEELDVEFDLSGVLNSKYLPAFIIFLLSLIFCFPLLNNFDYLGQRDMGQHMFYPEVERLSFLEYGQVPHWNPFYCGGNIMLGHSYSQFFYPTMLLRLLFGTVAYVKLSILLHIFVGMLGMYYLARHYGSGRISSYLPGIIFMLSSFVAAHLQEGNWTWVLIGWIPWAFLFYLKSYKNYKYVFLSALFVSLIFLGAHPYGFSLTMVLLGFHAGFTFLLFLIESFKKRSVNLRRLVSPIIILVLISILIICISAVKLFPVQETASIIPREESQIDHVSGRLEVEQTGFTFNALFASLFSRDQGAYSESLHYLETGNSSSVDLSNYLGIIPFLLALAGIFLLSKKELAGIFIILISLIISFGSNSPFNLYHLTRYVPVVKYFANPARYKLLYTFFLALFAAFMLSKIESMKLIINKKKVAAGKYLAIFLVLLVLINVLLVNMPLLKSVFVAPSPDLQKSPEFYQTQVPKLGVGFMDASQKLFDAEGNAYDLDDALISMHNSGQYVPLYDSPYGNGMLLAALENRGVINCYEHYKLPIAAQPKYFVNGSENPEYFGEAYLVNGDPARISYFSPNKITVDINTDEPTILVLNQNFHKSWKVQDKGDAVNHDGLISISVSPSDKQVTFYYSSSSFKLGLIITLLTLIMGFILFFRFDYVSKRLNNKTATQKR